MIKLKDLLVERGLDKRDMLLYGESGNAKDIKSKIEREFDGRWEWEDKKTKTNVDTDISTADDGLVTIEYVRGQLITDLSADEFMEKAKSIRGFRVESSGTANAPRGDGDRAQVWLKSEENLVNLSYLPGKSFPENEPTIFAEFKK